ncbi:hypothetical protein [Aurantiacibacter luteus]|uniref:hypothetical protein n=1 Tax=Aurantiacibacter luteus TaxID=1581420 RepID=UPI00069A99BE|nr:hypothetical protein [Aurantiacibacter luteus]
MIASVLVDNRYLLQYGIFAALAAYACLRGESPEKITGLIFVAAIVVEFVHHLDGRNDPGTSIDLLHLVLDAGMFVGFAIVAMRANRIYPLCILAMQLIVLVMHFQRALFDPLPPIIYWIMVRLPSYLQMVAFAWGLAAHRRRARRGIHAPPWRSSLRR